MSFLKLPILLLLVFIFCISCVLTGMKMIPERATVDFINEKYVRDLKVNVRRYGRKSEYYVNVRGSIKHTWGNNVSFHIVLYEFLHNEYKRTFVEFHFNRICDMINSDPYLGKTIAKTGIKCPAKPGTYLMANMTAFEDFPFKWPFERARAAATVVCNKVTMANASLYVKFVPLNTKKP